MKSKFKNHMNLHTKFEDFSSYSSSAKSIVFFYVKHTTAKMANFQNTYRIVPEFNGYG